MPTPFWGPVLFVLSFLGSRRPTWYLLAPGPPPFIFSFIPAYLFGVGLKGAGLTHTGNGISRKKYWRAAIRERGHTAAALI